MKRGPAGDCSSAGPVGFTNTAPVDAYRGAGRPEVAYIIERLMDLAARELGLGQDEIRLRNFIQPGEMPYTTAAGATTAWTCRTGHHDDARPEGGIPCGVRSAVHRSPCHGHPGDANHRRHREAEHRRPSPENRMAAASGPVHDQRSGGIPRVSSSAP